MAQLAETVNSDDPPMSIAKVPNVPERRGTQGTSDSFWNHQVPVVRAQACAGRAMTPRR